MSNEQCYMCSRLATTREHVPPSCIFPENKDLAEGVNYRKNLIKVPACPDHNLKKSGDDEYLLFVLAGQFEGNAIALGQWLTKIKRAMLKSPSKSHIYKDPKAMRYRGVETGMYSVNRPRLARELENIGRGLYFSHYGEQWLNEITVVLPFTFALDSTEFGGELAAAEYGRSHLAHEKQFGDNPDVFYYQVKRTEAPEQPAFILRMIFYGGVEVILLSAARSESQHGLLT